MPLPNIFRRKTMIILLDFINKLVIVVHDFTFCFKYIIFWNCIYFFKINNILKLKIGICITYSATSHHTVLFINCCHHTNTQLVFYVFFSCFLFILVGGVCGGRGYCWSLLVYATVPCNMKRTYTMLAYIVLWVLLNCSSLYIY